MYERGEREKNRRKIFSVFKAYTSECLLDSSRSLLRDSWVYKSRWKITRKARMFLKALCSLSLPCFHKHKISLCLYTHSLCNGSSLSFGEKRSYKRENFSWEWERESRYLNKNLFCVAVDMCLSNSLVWAFRAFRRILKYIYFLKKLIKIFMR